jgi:predicted nucleic acid-binding protein
MRVAFDASFLVILFNPKSNASVARAPERVDGLIEKLSNNKDKIIVPTPALAEILVALSSSGPSYVEKLKRFSCFQVRAFDERAAVEFGAAIRAKSKSKRKDAKRLVAQNKVKFDHQIVAIAKVQGAKALYSDDKQLRSFARECGMEAYGLADLAVPMKQGHLQLESTDDQQMLPVPPEEQ